MTRPASAALLSALVATVGCAARGGAASAEASPATITARGDWDDIEASAIVAASRCEMAVLIIMPRDDDRVIVDLVTVRDEPARVVASRRPEGMIELECRVGRFGDPARERELLRAMARRLGDLAGRNTAPLR